MTCTQDFQSEAVIRELIERSGPTLRRSLRTMLSAADTEDVIQESLLKVFVTLQNKHLDSIDDFFFKVARNAAVDRLRANARQTALVDNAPKLVDVKNLSNERLIESELFHKHLGELITQLPPKMRNVFIARQIKGMPHKEIAAAFGISPKTVENHLVSGMKLIRTKLLASGYQATPSFLLENE